MLCSIRRATITRRRKGNVNLTVVDFSVFSRNFRLGLYIINQFSGEVEPLGNLRRYSHSLFGIRTLVCVARLPGI